MAMKPPIKYQVILAFDNFRVGQIIEPTGLWAGELMGRGFIKRCVEMAAEPKQISVIKRKYKRNVDAPGTI